MRKIRLKPTESYCQKYLYTKIMTSKCKIIKYKLNANIFFQIYFCSTFSVRIQKVKINWKGRRLFERRHSKNTIWCESTFYLIKICFIHMYLCISFNNFINIITYFTITTMIMSILYGIYYNCYIFNVIQK